MEEFSNVRAEIRLSKILTLTKILDQFLQTLQKLIALIGAIYLLSLLWDLMSFLRQVVSLIHRTITFFVSLENDLFSFLADLTQTIENVYEICTNIVPTITQALKSLPNQIVEGVKKAHGSWF